MKKALFVSTLFLFLAAPLFAEQGVVAKRVSGCDYMIVDVPSGYAVLEWYGGYDPDVGDVISGSFKTYGFHTFFFSRGREMRAYVEDWGLDEDDALEKLSDSCD